MYCIRCRGKMVLEDFIHKLRRHLSYKCILCGSMYDLQMASNQREQLSGLDLCNGKDKIVKRQKRGGFYGLKQMK